MNATIRATCLATALLATPALAAAQGNMWAVPADFATIQDAVDSPAVAARRHHPGQPR